MPTLPIPLEAAAAATFTLAAAAGTLAWAGLSAGSQLFGPVLTAPALMPGDPNQLALTFDDGPNPIATPRLLDILARHQVHATFFLIGTFAQAEPALTRRILAEGHTVGNHTLHHPWLQFLPEPRIRAELAGCSQALEDILGQPIRLFRPPHGARRPAVLRIASELGMATVNWNVIVQDWKPVSDETILNRCLRAIATNDRRRRASSLVLHDGGHTAQGQPRLPTIEAVDRLIARLKSRPNPPVFVNPQHWLPVP